MSDTKRYRDPIHQFIELDERAQEIMASDAFQRLRGIGQLALTHLVYAGARHSRFEHSVGAMHAADRLARALGFEEERRDRVRLAALSHDVGHGPFSHVLDAVMNRHIGFGLHERISREVIVNGPLRGAFKDDEEAQFVAALIDPPEGARSVDQDIVSGPTDADKLDYLLRDSYYCGVQYGIFDLERILETARETGDALQSQLGFDESGLEAVEGLLVARRSMHRTVYRQSTRRATDVMLQRSMLEAMKSGDAMLLGLIPPLQDGEPVFDDSYIEQYLALDDEIVRRHLEGLSGPAGELARALRSRQLVHEVCQVNESRVSALRSGPFLAKLKNPKVMTFELAEAVSASIASDLGTEAHWVFLTVESVQNPLYRAPGSEEQASDILIAREDDQEYLHELSDLWGRSDVVRNALYLSLFTNGSEKDAEFCAGWTQVQWAEYVLQRIENTLSAGGGM